MLVVNHLCTTIDIADAMMIMMTDYDDDNPKDDT